MLFEREVPLSGGFALLEHAISRGRLFAFFSALLTTALWLLPSGVLALPDRRVA